VLGLALLVPGAGPSEDPVPYQTPGVRDNMPAFRNPLAGRLTFELSWTTGKETGFAAWRRKARARVFDCLLAPPPPAPFDPVVLAEQDRGAYLARKVVFNLTTGRTAAGPATTGSRRWRATCCTWACRSPA
jgi:hypothetical protein